CASPPSADRGYYSWYFDIW
nr:immunoglobulin heavy chain junction region [Macaca mulatta]MOX95130.1 immunoglobulin heavy chain junction region [Macaca mulatta]MOX96378.1 immunoglobulin heavy chain junction region [Macaca mulatta]